MQAAAAAAAEQGRRQQRRRAAVRCASARTHPFASTMEDADLMSIGRHCAHVDCHQLDFLPFTCGACKSTFCAEHRSQEAHACPKPGVEENKVAVCPLCAQGLRVQPGEDANAAFDRCDAAAGGAAVAQGRAELARTRAVHTPSAHTAHPLAQAHAHRVRPRQL